MPGGRGWDEQRLREEVAAKGTAISRSSCRRYLRGEADIPGSALAAIAEVLGWSLTDRFTGERKRTADDVKAYRQRFRRGATVLGDDLFTRMVADGTLDDVTYEPVLAFRALLPKATNDAARRHRDHTTHRFAELYAAMDTAVGDIGHPALVLAHATALTLAIMGGTTT